MKEHIYTIPVTDGFAENGECAFCNMYRKLYDDAVDSMLAQSYMQDDIRMETNKAGFCGQCYDKMYKKQNRLGLALMLHTHLRKINEDMAGLSGDVKASGLFKRPKTEKMLEYLTAVDNSCYICGRVDETFNKFVENFFYMWLNTPGTVEYVKTSKGFCLNHFAMLVKASETMLNTKEQVGFLAVLIPLQLENLRELEADMSWFVKKFDYRFNDEPWKNSKDALPRAILKVSSCSIET